MSEKKAQSLISIVIRNRNESEYLGFALEAIERQQLVETEVIVVDNESTDDSRKVARRYGCRILNLPKESFTYGRALNVGLAEARGEICVLLSAHSMLIGPYALYSCLAAFEDRSVAATRFLHGGKRFDVKRWIAPELLSGARDVDTVVSKGPLANGCAIRKSVWEEIRFDETALAAEDKIWALAVLQKGGKIFSPCPAAYFYLRQIPWKQQIKKNNRELLAIYSITGVRLGHFRESAFSKAKKFASAIIARPASALYKILLRMILEFSVLFSSKKTR